VHRGGGTLPCTHRLDDRRGAGDGVTGASDLRESVHHVGVHRRGGTLAVPIAWMTVAAPVTASPAHRIYVDPFIT